MLTLEEKSSHYLASVLRMREGERVCLFNGRQGEWGAIVRAVAKRHVTLQLEQQHATLPPVPDHWLLFAPIKNGRIDWVAEKATELGVRALGAVRTARTIVSRVNEERLRAHAIEAAEQTGRHDVPDLLPYRALDAWLDDWPADRHLIFCDETGQGQSPQHVLPPLRGEAAALLIGPEGGFSEAERTRLRAQPFTTSITLGPRILRADTAAITALSCVQLFMGDWQN